MIQRLLLAFTGFTALACAQPLKLTRFDGPAPAFREEVAGVYQIDGPMSLLATPEAAVADGPLVLEFEAFCVGGVPAFAVLPGPPYQAETHRRLAAIGHSETWTPYAARLNPPDKPMPPGWKSLRLDLPIPAGKSLQLRNLKLRAERPGEFDAKSAARSTPPEFIEAYLSGKSPASIDRISVTNDSVTLTGRADGHRDGIFLAEIPMERLMDDPERFETLDAITFDDAGRFTLTLPRIRDRNGLRHDRLLSRWQLVRVSETGRAAHSHSRYADDIVCRSPDLPAAKPSNKKGLGGWHAGRLPATPGEPDELDALGISAVTVNVMIHSLVSLTPGANTTPIQWQGRTYHAREDVLANLDRSFLEAAKRNIMVSAILLVANPARDGNPVVKRLGHPDAHPEGTFAMPNVTDPEGLALYGAILNLMAERWSRPDGKHGRIHHWIMHNEVDAGWVWTNAGEKPAIVYMDLLHRSMRLMDLIGRQYDPNGKPFLSLTHHWAHAGEKRWFGSKTMVDLLVRFSQAEGDFPWAVAYHPYPQNLFNPRTWEDGQATFSFQSAKITPKNLEVLDAYMRQPALLHQGKVRPVHLSENGFNSKDYTEKELADQAAGMALAWKKIQSLSSIESWQYHNWIDNRHEGGLKIGLRKFPDEPGDPHGKKPIWHLYQALATENEDAACAPYLPVIGITKWEEILHRGEIER
jgi:hypothetical protein